MMNMVMFLPIVILLTLLIIGLPIFLGVWTYKDAKKRNMNAAVWTLVVVLVPSLIGFVIYLIVRSNHSDLRCPSCDGNVWEHYVSCPMCGAKLKETCEECGHMVEPVWAVCPNCSKPLSHSQPVVSPVRKKDKGLSAMVVMVFAIPLLVFLLVVASLTGFLGLSEKGTVVESGSSAVSYEEEEFAFKDNAPTELKDWVENAKNGGQDVAILEYRYQEKSGLEKIVHLVYWQPTDARICLQPGVVTKNGVIYEAVYMDEVEWDEENEQWIKPENDAAKFPWTLAITDVDENIEGNKAVVYIGEKKINVEITQVDYDFSQYIQADILIK